MTSGVAEDVVDSIPEASADADIDASIPAL